MQTIRRTLLSRFITAPSLVIFLAQKIKLLSSKFHLVFMMNHVFFNFTTFHPFTWQGGAVPST